MLTFGTLVKVVAGFYLGCTGYLSEYDINRMEYIVKDVVCTIDNVSTPINRAIVVDQDQVSKIEKR